MASKENITVSVVPWFNAAQFKKVYEYLFSDEITKKKWAVDTISVWETRCHPSLPTAIEATYVLTSAVIQDILWTNKTTLIHHTDLQGIYGSAITRFVSLIVDVNKNAECPRYSLAEVAKSIGIPSFIVDIRNEWCHSVRPSLSMLRLATQSALKYLKESYWVKEAARVNNYVKQPLDNSGLTELFLDFIKYHQDTLKSIKVRVIQTDSGGRKLHHEYSLLLKKLERHLKANKRFFVNVLIQDGIFIPTKEQFKRAVDDSVYVSFDTEYFVDDGDDDDDDSSNMDEEESEQLRQTAIQAALKFESENFPQVPCYHEDLWDPILIMLNQYDVVPLFMEDLLKSQGDRTVVGQKILIAWILKILIIHSEHRSVVAPSILKNSFRRKGIVTNWLRMLHSALINPCKYTLILLPKIIKNIASLKKKEVHRIIGLISLKLGLVPIYNRKKDYWKLFHSATDLKEALEYQRNNEGRDKQRKRMKQTRKDESIWTRCPDSCYETWPIGYILNAVKDADDEEEEEEIFEFTFKGTSEMETNNSRMLPSNKNEEDDDEDETCKMDVEPDLNKMMREIDRRKTVLYKKSG